MAAPSKYLTLRDSASPSTTVNLYWLVKQQARGVPESPDTKFVLHDGSVAFDYGTEKRRWEFMINIKAGDMATWTSGNLTSVQTLYALRTTQTIQLVDNYWGSGEVYTVHFNKFRILSQDDTGKETYLFELHEA